MTARPGVSRRTVLRSAAAAALGLAACLRARLRAGSGPTSGQRLATLADIAVGEAIVATDSSGQPINGSDGRPILVARPTATTAAAFSSQCTHLRCMVAAAGRQLRCPCHGSVFVAATGAVIQGPAPRALATVAVRLVDGAVVAS